VSRALVVPRRLPPKILKRFRGAFTEGLNNYSHATIRSYRISLTDFATWLASPDVGVIELPVRPKRGTPEKETWIDQVIAIGGAYLVSLPEHEATLLCDMYLRDHLYKEPRRTRATAEIRLTALRWAVREAKRLGHITWTLETKMPRPRKTAEGRLDEKLGRDMRGPTTVEVNKLFKAAQKDKDPRAMVLLSLFRFEGYREHEVRQLNLADVDFKAKTVVMVRKKRGKSERYPLSEQSVAVLRQWIKIRGRKPGPLVMGGHRGRNKKRMSHSTAYDILKRLSKRAGIRTMSPHRVRHRACTDLIRVGVKNNLPEEDLLYLTGHSSRTALLPYYEATKSRKAARAVLNDVFEFQYDED